MQTSHYHDDTEAHDEGYFASFTDLLVGVLFIFIILLMVFAGDLQDQTEQAERAEEKAAQETEKASDAKERAKKAAEAITGIRESRTKLLRAMENSLKEKGVDVSIDADQGILRLPESVLFERGKSNLRDEGEVAVIKLALVLGEYLPCMANVVSSSLSDKKCNELELKNRDGLETVLIEGHTDSVGNDGVNWNLSFYRANHIFMRLTQHEPLLDKNVVNLSGTPVLAVSAYAARRPVHAEDTTDAKNRRIDLRFIIRSPTPEDVKKLQETFN